VLSEDFSGIIFHHVEKYLGKVCKFFSRDFGENNGIKISINTR